MLSKKSLTEKERERLSKLQLELGYYPGALNSRNKKVLENISGDSLPPQPSEVLRLHMELYNDYPGQYDTIILKKYGALKHSMHISRDVIVPSDIPLYALHYVIQRTFGWENSHLREFQLPIKRFNELCCNNAYMWSRLVGVIFKSPLMDEEDEFWADDYNGGSFKNWLRKKYTGPYLSRCYGEGVISCQEDMSRLDMTEKYYLMYQKSYNLDSGKYDGEELLTMVSEVYDYKGDLNPEPQPWNKCEDYRVEVVPFSDIPSEGLRFLFERDPMALLERLPISAVLSSGLNELPQFCSDKERVFVDERIIQTGEELHGFIGNDIKHVLDELIDSPMVQPYTGPITDELIYRYDFGDGWKIRITASENCSDLVTSGRITQTELDRANVKCREVYRPVLIARDGEMLMDDVGGLSGFVEFLQDINPNLADMTPEEKEEAKQRKKELLTWAKGMGWHREKIRDFNLL